jgi:methionyl-tRNA formyltransferase
VTRLRLAFMGTPQFAAPSLEALIAAGHEIAQVYCQPARPAGRGQKPRAAPVQRLAEAHGLALSTPTSLKDPAEQARFAGLALDAGIVVAYGLLLPKPILASPRLGCLNVHASLLPRWRGAAPIQRAILGGDEVTGITIMQMDEGLDTGPILLSERLAIAANETAGSLRDRLAALGARLIVEALDGLAAGAIEPRPQPEEGAIYAAKLARAEERLDWREPAALLARRVRALAPSPGAWCEIAGERVRVLEAEAMEDGGDPGRLLDGRFSVGCGKGALRLLKLQRAGRRVLAGEEFLRGIRLVPGAMIA